MEECSSWKIYILGVWEERYGEGIGYAREETKNRETGERRVRMGLWEEEMENVLLRY